MRNRRDAEASSNPMVWNNRPAVLCVVGSPRPRKLLECVLVALFLEALYHVSGIGDPESQSGLDPAWGER